MIDSDRKIAILGDMKELGEFALEQHKAIIEFAIENGLHRVFVVGEEFCVAASAFDIQAFDSMDLLINHFRNEPIAENTVLIKGSRSMKMEQLIQLNEIWN